MSTDSATLTALFDLFRQREQVGLAKYGTTVDRTDLSLRDWLQHALEESMDLPMYLKRAIDQLSAPAAASTDPYRPTDAEVFAWMDRHNIDISHFEHWRMAIDDARSLHLATTETEVSCG